MRKLVVVLAVAAVLLPAAALAGGWATVQLSSTPKGAQAGTPWVVNLTVLQHGVTPLAGVTPEVRIDQGTRPPCVHRAADGGAPASIAPASSSRAPAPGAGRSGTASAASTRTRPCGSRRLPERGAAASAAAFRDLPRRRRGSERQESRFCGFLLADLHGVRVEALAEDLQHLRGDRGHLLDQPAERAVGDDEQPHRRGRRHGRGAGDVRDERDLADEVARAEVGDLLPALRDASPCR